MARHRESEVPGYVRADRIGVAPLAVWVPQDVSMLGTIRSKLYELIQSGDVEIVKVGRATLNPGEGLSRLWKSIAADDRGQRR